MGITDFYVNLKNEIKAEHNRQLSDGSSLYAYEEIVYLENALTFLYDNRMIIDEYELCYYDSTYRNARIKIHGYAFSEDATQLELYVCQYSNNDEIENISKSEIENTAAKPCLRFLDKSVKDPNFVNSLEKSQEAYYFAEYLNQIYNDLEKVKILVVTNKKAKAIFYKDVEIGRLNVRIEVFDIDRYFKVSSEGQPRDEIVVDFQELSGGGLPCVYVPKQSDDEYAFALTAIPGEVVYQLYNRFGERILEDNVRSYLSARGRKNAGIQNTLVDHPSRFMAYNNGLVIVADSVIIATSDNGDSTILQIKGLQIVNGGQTTASIYFAKFSKKSEVDLSRVRVATKIIEIGPDFDSEEHEQFIGKIARYSNTQNQVKESDFLSHSAFQVQFEAITKTIYLPDTIGQWFYERASGSYNTYLMREGRTPARRRHITKHVVPRKRVIKKTNFGQSIATWTGRPHTASLGGEKCLATISEYLKGEVDKISADYVKDRLSEYIIFYRTFYLLRGDICKQSPSVVRSYLLALLSENYANLIDLKLVWSNQEISEEFKEQIKIWGKELYDWMISNSQGRQLSEFGKKEDTWRRVRNLRLSTPKIKIPELPIDS